ncbi:AsnC family transcriptional regulator [Photobacterium proteolyticum]|uniref:AsnC family transcriptional regulator n=1 Tax=Photobacterium proteolyticum TaxID=1903952 RepID=A0A1Q9H1H2_9GAMM|nr:Lrp/AsnC family transcriptional regulator [Photobacterium proteolyticum]OLQ81355.1 AsnC family transcriptional regulator [Photobacterium proteolyticum]
MSKLDDTDRQLLSLLRKNARMPIVNLAKELRVSRATVQNRISKLEKEGIILGYTVKLKADADESVVKVIMSISVVAKDENKVLEQLHHFPEILSLYHTNGHWDLIAEIQAKNLTLLGALLGRIRSIEGIVQTEANLLLDSIF